MTLSKYDILRHISDSLDPEQILDRLQIDSERLTEIFAKEIMDSLEEFDDVYDPSLGEEDFE